MTEKKHTSIHYEQELEELREKIIYMGALVEKVIQRGIRALVERDSHLAEEIIAQDDQIDRLDVEIEEKCIKLLALRQPTAGDLRFITTTIKINGHLERIGDMAVNVARKVLILNKEPRLKPYIDLPRMAELAQSMIRESLDAFINKNVELANKVRRDDDLVDQLNEQIFRELLTYMMEDHKNIPRAMLISQIAKNIERISDHAKGIADMVIYMITGQTVRHEEAT